MTWLYTILGLTNSSAPAISWYLKTEAWVDKTNIIEILSQCPDVMEGFETYTNF